MSPRMLIAAFPLIAAAIAVPTAAATAAPPPPASACDAGYFEQVFGVAPDSGKISDAVATLDGDVVLLVDGTAERIEIEIRPDNWVDVWMVTSSARSLRHQVNPILPLRVVDVHTLGTPVEVRALSGASLDAVCTYDGNDLIDVTDASTGVDVSAGAGHDVIFGSNKDDRLFGGPGQDKMFGNDGDDLLHGGADKDVLDGGDQLDRCGSTAGGPLGLLDVVANCEKPL